MTAKIRFKRQYKPVGFGDTLDSRTVEGRRLSSIKAAETRRLNRIRRDVEDEEEHRSRWLVRLSDILARGLTHLKFRSWKW